MPFICVNTNKSKIIYTFSNIIILACMSPLFFVLASSMSQWRSFNRPANPNYSTNRCNSFVFDHETPSRVDRSHVNFSEYSNSLSSRCVTPNRNSMHRSSASVGRSTLQVPSATTSKHPWWNANDMKPASKHQSRSSTLSNLTKFQESSNLTQSMTEEAPKRFAEGYASGPILGRGGCAAVWSAVSHATGANVAVKHIQRVTTTSVPSGPRTSTIQRVQATQEIAAAWREVCANQVLSILSGCGKDKDSQIGSIVQLMEVQDTPKDLFLIFEKGGVNLTKGLFHLKGEFSRNQRIYRIHHQGLLRACAVDIRRFKWLIKGLLEALDKLHKARVVHSDLKPDNILIRYGNPHSLSSGASLLSTDDNHHSNQIKTIKKNGFFSQQEAAEFCTSSTTQNSFAGLAPLDVQLIDFGSAYLNYKLSNSHPTTATNVAAPTLPVDMRVDSSVAIDTALSYGCDVTKPSGVNTPEYMPPECLDPEAAATLFAANGGSNSGLNPNGSAVLFECAGGYAPHATDVWSIGCVLLEMINGVPLWLSYPAKVVGLEGNSLSGKDVSVSGGLFAVPGKAADKIVAKQMNVLCSLDKIVKQKSSGVPIDNLGLDLIKRMLAWRPVDRISPSEALKHPFLVGI